MHLLLDTQILLWTLSSPDRIDRDTRLIIENPANVVMFSAASVWEIAIKASLKRKDFEIDPDEVLREAHNTGLIEMPVTGRLSVLVSSLPWHHRDPFDRLLVAQALQLPAHLLTTDVELAPYSELVRIIR